MTAAVWERPLRAPSVRSIAATGTAVVIAGFLGALVTTRPPVLVAALCVIAVAAVAYLAVWLAPSTWVVLALLATAVSGQTGRLGLPVPPDRLLLLAAGAALLLRLPGATVTRRIVWRPTHVALALAAAYGTVNALQAGTLTTGNGFFTLLDRFALVPMLVFALAPIVFGTPRARNALLVGLVIMGAYLGLTALAETLHLSSLVWPRYILDPSVGIHFGRARGPFVEAVADGLAMYGCAVAAAVAIVTWRARWARIAAAAVLGVCLFGTLLTLTRAVWLGTVVASVVAMLLSSTTRRLILPAVLVGLLALGAALAFVPDFHSKVSARTQDASPVWERYATDAAAIRAVEDHPLFGVGWQRWLQVNHTYLQQGADYPLTNTVGGIQIHNVLLSHAAELGLVGVTLWLLALGSAIAGGILRRGPADLDPWRLGLVAVFLQWAIVASFGPLSYPFPNLLLWAWAGVASIGHLSAPIEQPHPA